MSIFNEERMEFQYFRKHFTFSKDLSSLFFCLFFFDTKVLITFYAGTFFLTYINQMSRSSLIAGQYRYVNCTYIAVCRTNAHGTDTVTDRYAVRFHGRMGPIGYVGDGRWSPPLATRIQGTYIHPRSKLTWYSSACTRTDSPEYGAVHLNSPQLQTLTSPTWSQNFYACSSGSETLLPFFSGEFFRQTFTEIWISFSSLSIFENTRNQ